MAEQTVPDLLEACAVAAPDQHVVFPDERSSWPDLRAQVRHDAAALLGLGVAPGDRVAVLLHGGLDAVRYWLAASEIGAITVPLTVRMREHEAAQMIDDAGPVLALTTSDFLPVLDAHLPDRPGSPLRTVVVLDRTGPDAPAGVTGRSALEAAARRSGPAQVDRARAGVGPDTPAIMLYTSGTTARPRGCVHTHRSLADEGAAVAGRLGLTPQDRFWTPLPMFHCGGYDVALAAMAGRCGFVHVGSFEPGRALDQMETERCTVAFPAFETIWMPVLDHPTFPDRDLSALRLVINIGAPERMRSMQARLPHAIQLSCLGMTESLGFCCVGSPDDPAEVRATTSGRPLPHMEARVVDPETGEPVPPGTPGEFRFRGTSRMAYYHRDPDTTAARIDDVGWFASGDQVVADDEGRLRFRTRLKDVLKVGGENVAATEVEGFLCEHPAAGIVQVVAAPDARYGEVVCAFVELRDGHEPSDGLAEEMIAFCVGRIAGYKVPRYVRFVDEWPMSGTKVQKFRLQTRIAEELSAAGITEAPRGPAGAAPR
ncbi:fatty-acyl-CoA synthase [Pseudonocardia ammonioxydans]|uniref:Fatty-acyl-CoA synthase n=1 Tax=Pseudonocardia ammonioxydans TaxID=260086 RepID=A0A1I5BWX0_PSUAM|nr:AMP-binding protein [Pseudonocardia ammonioxydans]SFN79208.1 fatty-acyl-CoA synthase [Pseudonocardia ammonioxydans]